MQISETLIQADLNTWISSLVDTLVSLLVRPESEPETMTPAIFGPSSPVSFASYDRDTCSWKTSQATFHWGSETFSETWPDSGTMRNGCVFERQTSERPISESASSSWPTPQAHDQHGAGTVERIEMLRETGKAGYSNLNWSAQNWPTARGEDGESCGNHPGATDSLTGVTRHWQTPATDSFRSRGGNRVDEMGLDQQARMHWATPAAHERAQDPRQVDHGVQLANQVDSWQTPQALDHRSGASLKDYRNTRPLNEQGLEVSLPVPPTPDGPQSSATVPTSRLRLNPRFVEWLMGFPIGWSKP